MSILRRSYLQTALQKESFTVTTYLRAFWSVPVTVSLKVSVNLVPANQNAAFAEALFRCDVLKSTYLVPSSLSHSYSGLSYTELCGIQTIFETLSEMWVRRLQRGLQPNCAGIDCSPLRMCGRLHFLFKHNECALHTRLTLAWTLERQRDGISAMLFPSHCS